MKFLYRRLLSQELEYNRKALAQMERGNFQGAIESYTQLIQLKPEDASAFGMRGLAHLKLKHYQTALADFDRAIQLNQLDGMNYHFRGIAHSKLGDYQKSLTDLSQAIQLVREPSTSYYHRGLSRLQLKNYAGAIADYDRAIQLDPRKKEWNNYTEVARRQLPNAQVETTRQNSSSTVAGSQAPSRSDPGPVVATRPRLTDSTQTDIYKQANEITVLINAQHPGSGVMIAKTANTYYVLTAKHVVATEDEYTVITLDGKRYPLDYRKVKKLPNVDLAILQFTSDRNYAVAHLGNSKQVSQGATVYVSGWPIPEAAITKPTHLVTEGQIAGFQKEDSDGYDLLYGNSTAPGMSGGPVLDSRGQVIGIHGRAAGNQVSGKVGINLGIPINLFLQSATQAGVNLKQLGLKAER